MSKMYLNPLEFETREPNFAQTCFMKFLKYDSQILKFWIFLEDFLDSIDYELVCNKWKVDKRPTRASDV
jgi:hypothetical protein